MDNKKATIKDVASHSQVSIKTVSRVINNEYGVSKITKSRVLKSIKALDYNPNKAAQGLRSKKSFLIGLVYDNPDKFYLSDIQSGVLETCAVNGFSVVLFPCNHQKELYIGDQISDQECAERLGLPFIMVDSSFSKNNINLSLENY